VDLLANDAVLHTDGGGKALALATEVRGAEQVARTILDRMGAVVPRNLVVRMTNINGEPGFVSYLDGKPFSAFTVNASGGRVQTIYIVTNPEKLAHLPNLPGAPS